MDLSALLFAAAGVKMERERKWHSSGGADDGVLKRLPVCQAVKSKKSQDLIENDSGRKKRGSEGWTGSDGH